MSATDTMAAQLAQLLAGSDRDEIEEIVTRWKKTAATSEQLAVMEKMGEHLIALKLALDSGAQKPSRADLELALRMMLTLANAP